MDEILFPYQKAGVAWLQQRRVALLAYEMGLGKSAVAITAADNILAKRILVVCPAVARVNWLREFEKFSKTSRQFVVARQRSERIDHTKSVITSYDLAASVAPDIFGQFDVVVLDEVHYLKNHRAKRTKALFGKKGIVHGQKTNCKIWVLSGTPAPNHAGELWTLLYTFGFTRLSYDDFCKRFCVLAPALFGTERFRITGTKKSAIPELRGILNGIMLRKTKDEVGHMLPKIFYSNVVVEPGKVDFEVESSFIQYVFPNNRVKELEDKLRQEVALVKDAINTKDIEILMGLAKSVSTLRRYIGIQKVEHASKLVAEELEAGLYDKIVVFAIHRDVIEGLRVRLKDFGAVTLYGGTRFDSANKNIDKFNTNPRTRVFIGNITACGIAINLTAAHNVMMVEQDWTPAANAQAIARCHRHGQKKNVSVRMVGLANSLDEHVAKLVKKKTEELTQLFDGDKSSRQAENLEDLLT